MWSVGHLIDGHVDGNVQMTQHRSTKCHCHADFAAFLKSDPFLLPIGAGVRPELTLCLSWRNRFSPTAAFCHEITFHRSSPNEQLQSFLAFPSRLYECWSSDADASIFSQWSPPHRLSDGGFYLFIYFFVLSFPAALVDDQSWPHGCLEFFPSLNAVFSLSDLHCLMITSPVCFCLKASRQIFICFANLLFLSWLLYLLSSVLTLC